nr:putative glycolipid-binding domain-containing protein [Actinomycetota bacterium]
MPFLAPPPTAAWSHQDARTGFEVVYFQVHDEGHLLIGSTTAPQLGRTWIVDYEIRVDASWMTHSARFTGRSSTGRCTLLLEHDGHGRWQVDGARAPDLDGCLDIDLESSAMTNALPVHRLDLEIGGQSAAPAAYVRADHLGVERLEQEYIRTSSEQPQQQYNYAAPAFDFTSQLVYDQYGLVVRYPGIAVRAA